MVATFQLQRSTFGLHCSSHSLYDVIFFFFFFFCCAAFFDAFRLMLIALLQCVQVVVLASRNNGNLLAPRTVRTGPPSTPRPTTKLSKMLVPVVRLFFFFFKSIVFIFGQVCGRLKTLLESFTRTSGGGVSLNQPTNAITAFTFMPLNSMDEPRSPSELILSPHLSSSS